jgi:hypothetical protein
VLQPLDVGLNKPFKQNMRKAYNQWLRQTPEMIGKVPDRTTKLLTTPLVIARLIRACIDDGTPSNSWWQRSSAI